MCNEIAFVFINCAQTANIIILREIIPNHFRRDTQQKCRAIFCNIRCIIPKLFCCPIALQTPRCLYQNNISFFALLICCRQIFLVNSLVRLYVRYIENRCLTNQAIQREIIQSLSVCDYMFLVHQYV